MPKLLSIIRGEVHCRCDAYELNGGGESECRDQPSPETAIEFALALVERLYGKEKMEEVDGPLVSYKS